MTYSGTVTGKLTIVIAAVATVITLASCSQQEQPPSTPDDQPETVIVYRDSTGQDDSGNSTSSATSGSSQTSSTELPDGYPIPFANDHEVQNVRVRGDDAGDEGDVDVDLRVPDGRAAYDYYVRTLESEGFTIEETDLDQDSQEFDADIDFRNDEYEGSMDFSGANLDIDLDRQDSSASASGGTSGGSGSEEVPGDLPLPGDYEIRSVRVGGDDAGDSRDVSIVLDVPDGRAAYDFYVQNLESEGFRVEDTEIENDSSQFEGDIDFNGDNYNGNIDVNGNTVEIDIDRMDN